MGLFTNWLRRGERSGTRQPLEEWRRAWTQAVEALESSDLASLEASLKALDLPPEEVEIEREMLDGLIELHRLRDACANGGLPILETGHRVVSTDVCHFSAPASRPDDPAQPAGRLLLTSNRAIFAGGGPALTLAWHAIGNVVQTGRDVLLVRRDREVAYTFRCNSYGDALCGAYLARRLARRN